MWNFIATSLASMVGKVAGGLFNFKSDQGEVIGTALKTISDLNMSNDEKVKAVAHVYAADARSDGWLTRSWRPLLVIICVAMVGSEYMGWLVPKQELSQIGERVFDILENVVMVGYPVRSLEKIIKTLKLGSTIDILQGYVKKKLI